jgi:hypothetical protein
MIGPKAIVLTVFVLLIVALSWFTGISAARANPTPRIPSIRPSLSGACFNFVQAFGEQPRHAECPDAL